MADQLNHSISICFSTTDNWISSLIRWFTFSEVSHCYLTFRDATLNRVMVMESDWVGFRVVPWDSPALKGKNLIARYTVNTSEANQLKSIQSLVDFLGTGYNYLALLPLAARRIKKTMERPLTSPNKLICSESVVNFITGCGIEIMDKNQTWSPDDVFQYINANPQLFVRQE